MAAVILAGAGAGCSTTMQEAARLQLNSARIRASELSTRVTTPGSLLRVARVTLVSDRGSLAFVVAVHNDSARQLSDVPISVGAQRARHSRVYLNAEAGREYFYFDAHLPVVEPGRTLTWVYTVRRKLPSSARPFAVVGREPEPAVPAVASVPKLRATVLRPARSSNHLRVAVQNLSSVPQYQLQVYAVARAGHGYRAAGNATVTELAGQARTTLELRLVGHYQPGSVQVNALATTLQ